AVEGAFIGTSRGWRVPASRTALEARRGFGIAGTLVMRVLRVGAERTAAAGSARAGRGHGVGRRALLHPVDQRGQQAEAIERALSAAAVSHRGYQEQAAPVAHRVR